MPKWKGRAPARSDRRNHEAAEVHSEFTDSAVSKLEAAGAVRKVSENEVDCISALGVVVCRHKKRVILDLRFVLHIHVSRSRVIDHSEGQQPVHAREKCTSSNSQESSRISAALR